MKIRIIKLDDFTDYSYEFKQVYNANKYFEVIDKYNLDVLDKSGNPRNCFMTRTVATTITEGDQYDDKIFRNIYKYKIRVELDEQITYTVHMVTNVNLQFDK